jgi:hypothetical protein
MGLLLLGAVLTVVAFFVFLYFWSRQISDEDVKRKGALDRTAYQQSAIGIQCTQLKPMLADLMHKKVGPVIQARKQGETWANLVSQDLQNDLLRYDDYVSTCNGLYHAGEAG